jgi:hypothetical protein
LLISLVHSSQCGHVLDSTTLRGGGIIQNVLP